MALDLDVERICHLEGAAQVELIKGDVGDPSLLAKAPYWRTDVQAVEELATAVLDAGVGRFVHCRSVGVSG